MNDTPDYPDEIEQLSQSMTADDAAELLDGLQQRVKDNDVGEAFKPEIVEALALQEKANQSAFQALWANLKQVGVPIRDLTIEALFF